MRHNPGYRSMLFTVPRVMHEIEVLNLHGNKKRLMGMTHEAFD
jgi:hypothetical protein